MYVYACLDVYTYVYVFMHMFRKREGEGDTMSRLCIYSRDLGSLPCTRQRMTSQHWSSGYFTQELTFLWLCIRPCEAIENRRLTAAM